MATKGDVETVRLELQSTKLQLEAKIETTKLQLEAKIEAVRLHVEARIHETRSELMKWFVGMAVFQTLVILGARIFIK